MKLFKIVYILIIFILIVFFGTCNLLNPFNPEANIFLSDNTQSPGLTSTPIVTFTSTPTPITTPTYTPTTPQTATPTPTITPTDPPLTNWGFKLPITITENSSTTLTNYQVKISLTSSFSYNHVVGTNGEDLRFVINGTTFCDYWIEKWNDGSNNSTIWVEIPNLTSGGNVTVDMYYGLSAAIPKSNGNLTFLLFDDFNDNFFDTSKWRDGSLNSAYISETGQNIVLTNNSAISPANENQARGYLISQSQFPKNISMDFSIKLVNAADAYWEAIFQFDGVHLPGTLWDCAANGYIVEWGNAAGNPCLGFNLFRDLSNAQATLDTIGLSKDTSYHRVSMRYFDQHITVYMDEDENPKLEATDDITDFTTHYIGFANREKKTYSAVNLDYVFVRQFVSNEPTAVFGTEGPP